MSPEPEKWTCKVCDKTVLKRFKSKHVKSKAHTTKATAKAAQQPADSASTVQEDLGKLTINVAVKSGTKAVTIHVSSP